MIHINPHVFYLFGFIYLASWLWQLVTSSPAKSQVNFDKSKKLKTSLVDSGEREGLGEGILWGAVWANCYCIIQGEGLFDDDYNPTHWMPIPTVPISLTKKQ